MMPHWLALCAITGVAAIINKRKGKSFFMDIEFCIGLFDRKTDKGLFPFC